MLSTVTDRTLHVLQVSDSHLSPRAPYAEENWEAVVDCVTELAPDLVVHTGDISLDGANRIDDLEHARRSLERLPVPWVAVPGNHDIGDAGTTSQPVDDTRRSRYHAVFGDGTWCIESHGWRLVGLDVQTLLSDLPAAASMWEQLAGSLAAGGPTALFLHRPIGPLAAAEPDVPDRYVSRPARQRLTGLLDYADVRLVGSGHVHQWRNVVAGPRRHVWAPATWALLPDSVQPVIGRKVLGAVLHTLSPDGRVSSELVVPEGISQVIHGDDFASPYEHHVRS